MKIIKVCCFCDRWSSGGIESFLNNLFQNVSLNLLEIHLVATELGESPFTHALQQRGIRFIELSGNRKNLLKNCRKFLNLLNQERYDVVHLNIYNALSLCYAFLAKKMNVPVIIAHSHNTDLSRGKGRMGKLLLHCAAKELFTSMATDLWACSHQAAQFMFARRVLKRKGYSFIPNGIDLKRFRFDPQDREYERKKLGFTDHYVIGNVGRLSPQKNQQFLIEVFSKIHSRIPCSRLLLVGEGKDLQCLKEEARRLHVENETLFYGTTDHAERLFWAMDVFALPSRFEGLPVTMIEAQAAGLPVVCSDTVTQQAIITSLVKRVPLEKNLWVEALLNAIPSARRSESGDWLRKSGFDIREVAQDIEKRYMRNSFQI